MRAANTAELVTHFRSSTSGSGSAFVGRTRELDELLAALDASATGEGRSVLLVGDPGIGKTRLADALAHAALESGARVAWGRCWEAGGAPAHWPWVQVVRDLLDGLEGADLAAALGPYAEGVGALAPELRARHGLPAAAAEEGESARFAAWDATAGFLARAAADQPLVVVLDDVHAADVPSLLLLRFVARSLRGRRLLVVATVRDAEARARSGVGELVDEVRREGTRVVLRGLVEADVATLVAAHAGRRPPPRFTRELRRATDGNPFWVEEVVRLRLADAPDDPFALPCPVPAQIGGTLDSRVAALPDGVRDLLALAAVAGRDWDAARTAALAGADAAEVAGAVAAAADAGLVLAHAGGYGRHRFSHALVRDARYESLPEEQRRAAHSALAHARERSYDVDGHERLAQLAHHFAAAGADSVDKARAYARRAGDAASAALAFEEAAEHYDRAVALAGGSAGARCDLVLALGGARMRAGDTDAGREDMLRAAALARELGSAERLAAAALGFGSGGESWANGAVDTDLVALLEESLESLPTEPPTALRALVLARLADALLYAHDWKRTDELSASAIEVARASGDSSALSRALAARLLALLRPPTLDERLALVAELTELGERSGRTERRLEALAWQITLALEQADGAAVDAAVARYAAIAEEARQPHMLWTARVHAAMRAMLTGPLDEAERLAHEALAVAEGVAPLSAAMFAVQILGIRHEQGRMSEIEPGLRAFVAAFPAVRGWRATWVRVLLETGGEDEARAELEQFAREDFLLEPEDYEWPGAMTMLGEAFARIGDRERCAILYQRLLPYADRTVVVSIGAACGGPIARYLGLMAQAIGDTDAAVGHFEQSLELCERLGARTYAARTRLELGRLLQECGQKDAAAELLHRAAADADALGMAIGDEARALLPDRRAPAGATPLVFRRAGEVWEVGDPLTPARLRDSKGLRYVAELLARPGVDVPAAELAGASGMLGDAGPALDARAKDAYRRRLEDLESEREDGERWNDPERAARAQAELDAIADELAGAVGLGGRDRRPGSAAERARVSVTKAIRTAIRRIDEHDPALSELLDRSIRTGTFCRYEPPARERVRFTM